MYMDVAKITDPVTWIISHDKSDTHVFTIRAKIGDWTQLTLALTEKEAISLVEQLGFAIQDKDVNNGKV
jgi:hypothetical protein